MKARKERFISVDVETSGPIPGEYSMLTIGACDVDDDTNSFTCSIKPLNRNADPKALEVTGLDMDELARDGFDPAAAMKSFEVWLGDMLRPDESAVFVGFNAPFDWSFVNYYFHRFLGANPFGFAALDIKAYYMGATGCTWADTKSSQMAKRLRSKQIGNHEALDDARFQAELFRLARSSRLPS